MPEKINPFPIRHLPRRFQESERAARAQATDTSGYVILLRPGCHGEPHDPVIGYVETMEAARALAERVTHMPDGNHHKRLYFEPLHRHL